MLLHLVSERLHTSHSLKLWLQTCLFVRGGFPQSDISDLRGLTGLCAAVASVS